MEHKIFTNVQTKGLEDLECEAFISTEHPDRGGDILKADGMIMTGRVVVLMQHGQGAMGSEPIAKPLWIKPGRTADGTKGIKARMKFFDDDTGRRLWKKITEGILVNWSVGWRPLESRYQTEEDGSQTRVVSKWELLEFSPVGVPMNPYAQTIFDGGKSQEVWFKFLAPGSPVEPGYREMKADSAPPLPRTITIPDGLIQSVIEKTVKAYVNKLKGRVD